MASPDCLTITRADGVSLVTFDDGKANALSHTSIDALRDAVRAAASNGALVLAGRPGVFSAGLDLAVVRGGDQRAVQGLIDHLGELVEEITTLPVPVVAACTGHALAGGALLLMACDFRIGQAGTHSKIGLTEVAVGIPLPPFGHSLSRERLDRRFLLRATALAEVVDPDTAVSWGFLDATTEHDVVTEAVTIASTLSTSVEPTAFAATKRFRDTHAA